ncbi:MAG: DUF4317 family protein [Lachnospiraceae bacterium]|nr:DUF4317 family protein [Lachnospiraceae bacterium]
MNKKEVAEIKRRLKKGEASFSRVAGCYINGNKEKVCIFDQTFFSLEEEDNGKYLDLARKTLSGTLDNNLLNLDFPLSEEEAGGRQERLLKLRDSKLEDETLLNEWYDLVIDTYDHTGNYLILLFADAYDIPLKTSDDLGLDDSEEVYNYILCAICPVDLSKGALGYLEEEGRIGSRIRDWVVSDPESGFLFPSFNGRSTDIHQTLFYTKNAKDPHRELMEDILGCEPVLTASEMRESFKGIVLRSLGEEDPRAEEHYLVLQRSLNDIREQVEEAYGDEEEAPAVILNQELLQEALDETFIPDLRKERILRNVTENFEEQVPEVKHVVDSRALKANEAALERDDLRRQLAETEREFREYREVNGNPDHMPETSAFPLNPFFKSIIDQDPAPVVICDLSHIILYMNPAAVTRYAGRTAVGQNLMDCHPDPVREMIEKVVEWFRESPEHNRVFETYSEKENKDVYTVALRNEAGELIGYYEKHEYRSRETGSRYDLKD